MVGAEAGPTVSEGCSAAIGYEGTNAVIAAKNANGYVSTIADKAFTCDGEGQSGGPGFCGCTVGEGVYSSFILYGSCRTTTTLFASGAVPWARAV